MCRFLAIITAQEKDSERTVCVCLSILLNTLSILHFENHGEGRKWKRRKYDMSKIRLTIPSGDSITVPIEVITSASLLIRDMVCGLDGEADDDIIDIPLEIGTKDSLSILQEHMTYRFNNRMKELPRPLTAPLEDLLDEKDRELVRPWSEETTMAMVKLSFFLNDTELKDLSSAKLATFIMNKSTEEVRAMLGVVNDFTPEEEASLRKEHGMEL